MPAIYVLRDPRTGAVRYVGKADDPGVRLRGHLHAPSGRAMLAWVEELIDLGLRPAMQVVEVCETSCWQQRERRWIKRLRDRGIPLLNATRGGRGEPYARRHWIDKEGRARFYPAMGW